MVFVVVSEGAADDVADTGVVAVVAGCDPACTITGCIGICIGICICVSGVKSVEHLARAMVECDIVVAIMDQHTIDPHAVHAA